MLTVKIREEDEFIRLGQALKKAGLVDSGVDANWAVVVARFVASGIL